ncbi:MAG: hypothetical protein ACOVRM_02080, partial [Planctomycetaceae bacterium]
TSVKRTFTMFSQAAREISSQSTVPVEGGEEIPKSRATGGIQTPGQRHNLPDLQHPKTDRDPFSPESPSRKTQHEPSNGHKNHSSEITCDATER